MITEANRSTPVVRPGAAPSAAGFTLVELVVVVLMAAVVAGIAIPSINVARFRVEGTAMEVTSTLAAAQRLAVLRGHNVAVGLDDPGNRLRVHLDQNNDGVIQPGESVRWVTLTEGVRFGLGGAEPRAGAAGVSLFSFNRIQGDLPTLLFHRNGSASEEGVLYLTSGRSRVSGAFPKETRAVEVDRATGRVRCFSFATGTWTERCQ